MTLTGCKLNHQDFKNDVEKEGPIIGGLNYLPPYYKIGSAPDFLAGIQAIDKQDGILTKNIHVDDSKVNFNKPGTYIVTYTVSDSLGDKTTKEVEVYVKDLDAPVVYGFKDLSIMVNSPTKPNFLDGVYAYDQVDGDLTHKIIVEDSSVQYNTAGDYFVTYQVTDNSGNTNQFSIMLTVLDEEGNNAKPDKKYYALEIKDRMKYNHTIGFSIYYDNRLLTSLIPVEFFTDEWLSSLELTKTNISKNDFPNVYTASSIEKLLSQVKDPYNYDALTHLYLETFQKNSHLETQFFYLLKKEEPRYELSIPLEKRAEFKDHLHPIFLRNLEKVVNREWTYERFFSIYGTHVIIGAVFGGRIDAFCAVQSQNNLVNPSGCTAYTNAIVEKTKIAAYQDPILGAPYVTNTRIQSRGGDLLLFDFSGYDQWVESLNEKPTLIGFPEDGLIPIWELIPDEYQSLKEEMKKQIEYYMIHKQFQ